MLPCFYYLCTGLIMCNISKLYDIIIIKEKKDMNRFEYTILNLKEFDVRMRRFNWAIYFNGILVNTVWNDLDLYYFMLNKGIFKNLHYLNFSKIDKKRYYWENRKKILRKAKIKYKKDEKKKDTM